MEQKKAIYSRILKPFLEESKPEGGIDMSNSRWQKPGRGYGGKPGYPDARYIRFLIDVLYRWSSETKDTHLHNLADGHTRFMARSARETDPTWRWGNVLESIGLYHLYNPPDLEMKETIVKIIDWARKRKMINSAGEVSFSYFPVGYEMPRFNAKDAGWTNDLSLFGSGLVWAYEVTQDRTILEDAVSFSEYFIQPWKENSLGKDRYWHSGTWREDLGGTWVIGPFHYNGFEGTNLYGDEASWIFSSGSCIDFLSRLYRHHPDQRYRECCSKAAKWTMKNCQFDDGAIGICGRDDKWYGATGLAITQTFMIRQFIKDDDTFLVLLPAIRRAADYLQKSLSSADIENNGVEWVHHTTLADPLVNVAMLWLFALLGSEEITQE